MPGSAAPLIVLVDDETGAVLARIEARVVDITLIGTLARIALMARRQGRRVRLLDAGPELRGLLELVGLADAVGVQPGGQPEGGEELRVDEVVQARDLPA
jgi:hypothetical protein